MSGTESASACMIHTAAYKELYAIRRFQSMIVDYFRDRRCEHESGRAGFVRAALPNAARNRHNAERHIDTERLAEIRVGVAINGKYLKSSTRKYAGESCRDSCFAGPALITSVKLWVNLGE